jgi:hypothetical protein
MTILEEPKLVLEHNFVANGWLLLDAKKPLKKVNEQNQKSIRKKKKPKKLGLEPPPALLLSYIPRAAVGLPLVPDLVDHAPLAVQLGLVIHLALLSLLVLARLSPVAPLHAKLVRRPATR